MIQHSPNSSTILPEFKRAKISLIYYEAQYIKKSQFPLWNTFQSSCQSESLKSALLNIWCNKNWNKEKYAFAIRNRLQIVPKQEVNDASNKNWKMDIQRFTAVTEI